MLPFHVLVALVVCVVASDAACLGILNPYHCTDGCVWSMRDAMCLDVRPQPKECIDQTSVVVGALRDEHARLDDILACDNVTRCEFSGASYTCVEDRTYACSSQQDGELCAASPGCMWLYHARACYPLSMDNNHVCMQYSASHEYCIEGNRGEFCTWDDTLPSCVSRSPSSFVPWAHYEWCRIYDGAYCIEGYPQPWKTCSTHITTDACLGEPFCRFVSGRCESKVDHQDHFGLGVGDSMFPGEMHWTILVASLVVLSCVGCVILMR